MKRVISIATALVVAAFVGWAAGAVTEGDPPDDADTASAPGPAGPPKPGGARARGAQEVRTGCKDTPPVKRFELSCRERLRMSCSLGGIPRHLQGSALIGTRLDAARAQLQRAGCALRVVGADETHTDSEPLRYRLNVAADNGRVDKILGAY